MAAIHRLISQGDTEERHCAVEIVLPVVETFWYYRLLLFFW